MKLQNRKECLLARRKKSDLENIIRPGKAETVG